MLLEAILAKLLIWIALVLSLNFIMGKTSVLSVGHLAFFGIGSLLAGALLKYTIWAGFWSGLVLGALAGVTSSLLIGLATLRLRQDFFVILSVGFSELVYGLSLSLVGPSGLEGLRRPTLWGISLQNDWTYVLLILVPFLLLLVGLSYRFSQSPLERICSLVRTSEDAAAVLGISPVYYKLGCFCLGSTVAATCGVLFTYFSVATDQNQLLLRNNVLLFAAVLFGGVNSILGSILGGLLLVAIPQILESLFKGEFQALYSTQVNQLLFGFILLLTIRLLPRGLAGQLRPVQDVKS